MLVDDQIQVSSLVTKSSEEKVATDTFNAELIILIEDRLKIYTKKPEHLMDRVEQLCDIFSYLPPETWVELHTIDDTSKPPIDFQLKNGVKLARLAKVQGVIWSSNSVG